MTTVIKKFSNMLFAFVLCAGLVMTSCETADPAGKDPNNSDIIVFADPIVKQSCVYVFDTDGDGEISYGEAAAVTDLSDITLRFVKEFLTFDEFQYFINVKSIPNDLFKECNYLESIVLPKSIQTIGSNAFRECTSLKNIEFQEGLKEIGMEAFFGCHSLTKIEFPEGLETIGDHAFVGCRSLTNIEFSEGLETIGSLAFLSCTSLTNIELPEGLKEIGGDAFYSISLTSIFVKAEIPPYFSYSPFPFNDVMTIYVPSNKVDVYKNTDNWSRYHKYIVGYNYENNKVVE